jgi:hypothetical protein
MTTKHILGPALFAGLLAGTSVPAAAADDNVDEPPMKLEYDRTSREAPVVPLAGTCAIHVVAARDDRQNKETIGARLGGALVAGDAGSWVSDGLHQLKDFGFDVRDADEQTTPQEGVVVRTSLTRAYTWQIGLKLFSMVALKVQFADRNGTLQEKRYRAHGDKTNMWGAASEYVTTLNYGLNNLLPAMAKDLVSLCKGNKVEAYTYAAPEPVVVKK